MNTLQSIISRPVILGSTWYAYARDDRAPWGVAQNDLLIGKAPASLLLANELVCDEKAFQQEMLARNELGWTSSEILGLLKENGILRVRDFGVDVRQLLASPVLKRQVDMLFSAGEKNVSVLKAVRQFDNLLTDGLAAQSTTDPEAAPLNVFYWNDSRQPSIQSPFWAKSARVILPLFLSQDFYILPPPSVWPEHVKTAVSEIGRRQAPHLEKLARLEYSGSQYIFAIKEAHGSLDAVVDKYLREHRHPDYGTYVERLRHLFKVRKALHGGRVLQIVARYWAQFDSGKISEEEFVTQTDLALRQETDDLIGTRRTATTTLLASIFVSGVALVAWHADAFPTYLTMLGLDVTLLAKGICDALHIGDRHQMGWYKIGEQSASRR